MKRLIGSTIIIVSTAMFMTPMLFGQMPQSQGPPGSSMIMPTPDQKKDLDLSSKDNIIIQLQMNQLQMQYKAWAASDQALIAKIKKENNWGDDVIFDSQNRAFFKISKPNVSQESKKPALPSAQNKKK